MKTFRPSPAVQSPARSGPARRWGCAIVAAAALAGCSASGPQPAPGSEPAPAPRSFAPLQVPAEVVKELARLVPHAGPTAHGSIAVRELELGPQGPRVVLATGQNELCDADNCPMGLFADEAGTYRPLLLAMSSTPPKPHSLGRMGYPDLSVVAVDTSRELRLTRYQWDGRFYRAAGCRLVNRMDDSSRACVPTRLEDVPVVAGPPTRLCPDMNRMVDREPLRLSGRTALPDAFEIRGELQARVEGVRLAGRLEERELDALVRCLRAGGTPLVRQKALQLANGLSSMGWTARDVRPRGGGSSVGVALTATFVPEGDYTLLSLGVFDAAVMP